VIGGGPNQWAQREVRMAMAVMGKNRHYLMHTVQRRHFNSTARKVGYGSSAESLIDALVAKTPAVIEQVRRELPAGFSPWVADSVLGGLAAAAKALEGMRPE
jgi:serine/threonine-protein kinase HipA